MTSHPNGSDAFDSAAYSRAEAAIPVPADSLEEWLALPLGRESADERFAVRRLQEGEYESAWDCVDAAFGRKRPRALFDWLYRKNPYGRARVWVVEEKSSGRVLKTSASFPWPVWRGQEPLRGAFGGDAATVPDWQRKGLGHIRRPISRSHPWYGTICSISGPNENSRTVTKRRGEEAKLLGRLPGYALPLRAFPMRDRQGLAAAATALADSALVAVLKGWRRAVWQRHDPGQLHLEAVSRFTPEFDRLTLATMSFDGYWSPHGWQFLNWRYLDHPTETYEALTLVEADEPVGYLVLRIDRDRATIAEFAVGAEHGHAEALLCGAIEEAQKAGCALLSFFATPSWRHRRLFRRAGLLPVPTDNFLEASYDPDPVGSRDLNNWQLLPGDRDYH